MLSGDEKVLDYHVHTNFCNHSTNPILTTALAAQERGLTGICFTEHLFYYRGKWSMDQNTIKTYIDEIKKARIKVQIFLGIGFELDYNGENTLEFYNNYLKNHPDIDFILGAVHFITEMDIGLSESDPRFLKFCRKPIRKVFNIYFQKVKRAISTGIFDSIAHIDLIKRWSGKHFPYLEPIKYQATIIELSNLLSENNVAVEINTCGLHSLIKDFFPSRHFLCECFRKGVPLTFGSDCHDYKIIGRNLDEATLFAKHIGYTHFFQFKNRQKYKVNLNYNYENEHKNNNKD